MSNVEAASKSDLYRLLPSVDELLRHPDVLLLIEREGQPAVVAAIRTVLDKVRDEITSGHLGDRDAVQLAIAGLSDGMARQLDRAMEFSLKPVINATGVVLHTNL